MRLVRLEIQTLPGIEPGFSLENFAPGTNMVTGPNATGKSSLIRALEYLIGEPHGNDPAALSLAAVFESESGRWTVRRTGSQIVWEKDGRPSAKPPLPERDQLYCYWLSMENLLQADQRDEWLIAELQRELRGGYDLNALRGQPPFGRRPRIGQSESRHLRQAKKKLREIEAEYEALRKDEEKIPWLEEEVETARKAAMQVQAIEKALDLHEAWSKRREIEAGLKEVPKNMEKLRGDELERLKKIDQKREELRRQIEAQNQAWEAANRRLQETELVDGRPNRLELDTYKSKLEEARRKSDQRLQEQKRLEEASTAKVQALAALGGYRDIPKLDPHSVSEAELLARRLQKAENQCQELQNQLSILEDVEQTVDQATVEQHSLAANALREWLAHDSRIANRIKAAVLLAGIGGLVATVSAYFVSAWIALAGGVAVVGGALWALLEMRRDGAVAARQMFEQTELEPPETWERESVKARLQEIESKQVELREIVVRAQMAKKLQVKLARAEEDLENLQQEKTALAKKVGFDPTLTAAALDRFVRLVQDYDRAQRDHEAAKAAIARLDKEIIELVNQVRNFLTKWQAVQEEETNLNALEVGLTDLSKRSEQAETAEREMVDTEREKQRLERDIKELEQEASSLFEDAGLQPGDRAQLIRCCELFDDWRERQGRLQNARIRESERRAALEGDESLIRLVEADDRESLERMLEEAQENASKLQDLQNELTAIRTRLEYAGRDRRLEQALAEVDAARTALEDRYREVIFAEAANLLLDDVEQEYQSEHEPEVLRDTRNMFRRFTHHSFELELDEKEGFFARDLQLQARRNLSELSSGTRMQLLLAMRLAWTHRIEQGRESLPLFLDEALTTSDESRFKIVADSLEKVVKDEGRQVFYLSARRHEVALWERATGNRPHHIDLAKARFGQSDARPEDFMLPESEPLPAPDGHSPESYAAVLGVAPLDSRQPEGTIPLFYLLRDNLQLLYHLMEVWRISTLGQLEALLRSSGAVHAIKDDQWRRRLEARCKIARKWVSAWRRGRGKPVDRIALERSGFISGAFLDRIAALAESLNGDGIALIKALRDGEVPRFRSTHVASLEQWLEAEGYIDPENPLNPDDRKRQTLMDAGDDATPEEIQQVVRWLEAGLTKGGQH